jgi:hypothetical protein
MATLPQPHAARLRPPSWRDARLLVGVVLVLTSVAVGARVVAAADDSVGVWAAAGPLPPGHVLTEGDLRQVSVRIGAGGATYLTTRDPLPAGAVLLRGLGGGELVPSAAVGRQRDWSLRPVPVSLPGPAPDGLRPGSRVDVWSSARSGTAEAGGGTTFRPPVELAVGAAVASVSAPRTGLGSLQGVVVQVMLEESQVRSVLDALANGARVALVPAPGSVDG